MDPSGSRSATGPAQPPQQLSHRIASLADLNDYDSFDAYQSAAVLLRQDALPNRDEQHGSLASLTSLTTSPVSAGGHDSSSVPSIPTRTVSRRLSRKSILRTSASFDTIMEEDGRESIDMATLLHNAAPIARNFPFSSSGPYAPLARRDLENEDVGTSFDMTGYLGPATSQDASFVKKLQEKEASGKLTLGLGAGFLPDTTMSESEILATSPTVGREGNASLFPSVSLRRTFSRRGLYAPASPSPLAASPSPTSAADKLRREGTVKALAQNEANRRGEIVEVIMEEDDVASQGTASKVDLSVVSGPDVVNESPVTADSISVNSDRPLLVTARSLPMRRQTTQVFYPQPNWKPFSMRWPYLLMLILLSIGLGVAQELIYRMSLSRPLVTFHSPSEIPGTVYFAVKFAPTVITVLYGVLWQITDFEVKRLEAFYQLSKETGAAADESINVDYVTFFAFFRPFRALYCRHYAVAVSSIASLLAVSLVPTLGAAAIVLTPNQERRLADPQVKKEVMISSVWSRTLTATFFLVAALGCVLFWLLQSRRSGLLSDVRGIAGLASMAVVSHIMTDFKDMDVATHEDIHRKLRGHRYVLRNSSLAPLDDADGGTWKVEQKTRDGDRYRENHLSKNPHPLMLRAHGCIPFIVGILLFAGLLPTVLFAPSSSLSEHAPWLLTALAVCIKLGWGGLETSVRMMEPYYILSRRRAPAKALTLDYTAMPFLWVALQALTNGHLLVFFLGYGTVMAELLTVLVTSLATVEGRSFTVWKDTRTGISGEETALSFWVTMGLSTFILLYMSVVALVAFVRRRRPFLPRQPNTIASVLAFIHQSRMLYTFVGTSKMSNAEMLHKLEQEGNQYGLGWFEGRDGQTHCGVDQEELLSSYKAGYDYTRSNQPWNERPAEWL